MIRIRTQVFKAGQRRASVEIISVNQFTVRARKLDRTKTEREHVLEVLKDTIQNDHTYTITGAGGTLHHFFIEAK